MKKLFAIASALILAILFAVRCDLQDASMFTKPASEITRSTPFIITETPRSAEPVKAPALPPADRPPADVTVIETDDATLLQPPKPEPDPLFDPQTTRQRLQTETEPDVLSELIDALSQNESTPGSFIADVNHLLLGLVQSGQLADEYFVYQSIDYLARHVPDNDLIERLETLLNSGPIPDEVRESLDAAIDIARINRDIHQGE